MTKLVLIIMTLILSSCSKMNSDKEVQFESRDIFGGTQVPAGKWQSVVAFQSLNSDGFLSHSFCSGTLIAKNLILSAAHCVPRNKEFYIHSKVISLDNEGSSSPRYSKIKDILIHPKFRGPEGPWDYALIEVEESLVAKNAEVALIATDEEVETLRAQDQVDLVGFGKTETKLRGIKFEVETRLTKIEDQEFRAGGSGKDTCSGDSGGPVFHNFNGVVKLIGVTSRTPRDARVFCGESTIYGLANIANSWIQSEILYKEALDNPSLALEKVNEAISLIDYSAKFYVLRAKLNLELNKKEESQKDLVKAIALEQENIEALNLLAKLYKEMGNGEGERKILQKLITKDPTQTELFERLVKVSSKENALLMRAQGYFSNGDIFNSKKDLSEIEDHDQAKFINGFIALDMNDKDSAIGAWDSIKDKSSVNASLKNEDGDVAIFSMIKFDDLSLVKRYFAFKVNPETKDSYDTYPTTIAWTQKKLELLKLLVEFKVPFPVQLHYDEFLYHVKNEKIDLVRTLVSFGIDYNQPGRDGKSAKEIAIETGNSELISVLK